MKNPSYKFGMSVAEYEAAEGLRKHRLDDFAIAPQYFKWKETQKFTPSRSMQLGTLVHSLALEGREDFAIAPDVDKRTKDGKAAWLEFEKEIGGLLPITKDEAEIVYGSSHKVKSMLERECGRLGDYGMQSEASLFWNRLGIECKGRVDLLCTVKGEPAIVDVKTTADIMRFDYSVRSFRYDMQDAWYRYGAKEVFGTGFKFYFLVVDMRQPFLTQFVALSDQMVSDANDRIDSELERYKACVEANTWPELPPFRIIL
jgi:hypothetical protein